MPKRILSQRPSLADPIISQRSPFEVYLLALGVLLGLAQVSGYPISAAFTNAVGETVTNIWACILSLGCALGLVGIAWGHRPYEALLLERSGVLLVGGAALAYAGIVAVATPGVGVLYTVGVNFAFGAACIWRARQITARFKWAKKLAAIQVDRDEDHP